MAEEITQNQTESSKQNAAQQFEIAVLPLQNTTLFPETVVPLSVGRTRSIQAVEAALATEEKLIACVTVSKAEKLGGRWICALTRGRVVGASPSAARAQSVSGAPRDLNRPETVTASDCMMFLS